MSPNNIKLIAIVHACGFFLAAIIFSVLAIFFETETAEYEFKILEIEFSGKSIAFGCVVFFGFLGRSLLKIALGEDSPKNKRFYIAPRIETSILYSIGEVLVVLGMIGFILSFTISNWPF